MADERDASVPRTLESLKIVVTGLLAGFSRDEAKEAILTFGRPLVRCRRNPLRCRRRFAGIEVRKTVELGVTILDEDGLRKLLARQSGSSAEK